ncbi:MAG: prepilin-type N-terminal cleavage/methylation domain-containing protein [Patescibacteria group bacterium]
MISPAQRATKKKSHAYGFTLIELLVVVAIISLISSVAYAGFSKARANARDAKRIADLQQVVRALELYNNDFKDYPVSGGTQFGCTSQYCLSVLTDELVPRYIQQIPFDPIVGNINPGSGSLPHTGYYYCKVANIPGYQITVQLESKSTRCTLRTPATMPATGCLMINGEPNPTTAPYCS